MRFFLKKLSQE